MALIRFKRGTRANLDTAASSEELQQGEPYLITDEGRVALGTSTTEYVDLPTPTDVSDAQAAAIAAAETYTDGAVTGAATPAYVDAGDADRPIWCFYNSTSEEWETADGNSIPTDPDAPVVFIGHEDVPNPPGVSGATRWRWYP